MNILHIYLNIFIEYVYSGPLVHCQITLLKMKYIELSNTRMILYFPD